MKKYPLIFFVAFFFCNSFAQYNSHSDWNSFEDALIYSIIFKEIWKVDAEILSINKVKEVEIDYKSEDDSQHLQYNKNGYPDRIDNQYYFSYDSDNNLIKFYYTDYYRKSLFTFIYQNDRILSIYNYDEFDHKIPGFKRVHSGTYKFEYSPNSLLTTIIIPQLSPASKSYDLPVDSNSTHIHTFEYDNQNGLVKFKLYGQNTFYEIKYSGDTIIVQNQYRLITKYILKDNRIMFELSTGRNKEYLSSKYEYVYKSNGLIDKINVSEISIPDRKDVHRTINYDYKFF